MSPDQFRRYRQVGTYGAYRVVLRTVPGLTTGDGWTPGVTALKLANLVNDSLPQNARLEQKHFENGTRWGQWSGGNEARYWVARGWQSSWAEGGGLLPTPDAAECECLPEKERRLLESALFSAGSRRRVTAEALASAKGAKSHVDLCDALASSRLLSKELGPESLAPLSSFSRFADAAMHAMRGLWNEINQNQLKQAPTVQDLAGSRELRSRLDLVRGAAEVWLDAPGRIAFPHDAVLTRLASSMHNATTSLDQLRVLARHHHEHGGGRRWFREQDGKIVPLVADTGIASSDYRFRLRPLSRLAAQCGIPGMEQVLQAVTKTEFENTNRRELEDDEDEVL